MAIAEIKIIPLGTDSTSFSSHVAACYRVAEETAGIRSQLTPTSTIIEGDLDQVLSVVRKMHQIPFRDGVDRVITEVAIDDRRDKPQGMEEMVDTVLDEV